MDAHALAGCKTGRWLLGGALFVVTVLILVSLFTSVSDVRIHDRNFVLLHADYITDRKRIPLLVEHPFKARLMTLFRKLRLVPALKPASVLGVSNHFNSFGYGPHHTFSVGYTGRAQDPALTDVFAELVDDHGNAWRLETRVKNTTSSSGEYWRVWTFDRTTASSLAHVGFLNTNANWTLRLRPVATKTRFYADIRIGKLLPLKPAPERFNCTPIRRPTDY